MSTYLVEETSTLEFTELFESLDFEPACEFGPGGPCPENAIWYISAVSLCNSKHVANRLICREHHDHVTGVRWNEKHFYSCFSCTETFYANYSEMVLELRLI